MVWLPSIQIWPTLWTTETTSGRRNASAQCISWGSGYFPAWTCAALINAFIANCNNLNGPQRNFHHFLFIQMNSLEGYLRMCVAKTLFPLFIQSHYQVSHHQLRSVGLPPMFITSNVFIYPRNVLRVSSDLWPPLLVMDSPVFLCVSLNKLLNK